MEKCHFITKKHIFLIVYLLRYNGNHWLIIELIRNSIWNNKIDFIIWWDFHWLTVRWSKFQFLKYLTRILIFIDYFFSFEKVCFGFNDPNSLSLVIGHSSFHNFFPFQRKINFQENLFSIFRSLSRSALWIQKIWTIINIKIKISILIKYFCISFTIYCL